MNTLSTQKSIITLGVIIVLIFFGYSLFVKDGGVETEVNPVSVSSSDDILVLVETLKKISIDTSLFSSELFTGLQDFSITLYPEQQGRPNPFASVGADGNTQSAQAGQQSQTQSRTNQ